MLVSILSPAISTRPVPVNRAFAQGRRFKLVFFLFFVNGKTSLALAGYRHVLTHLRTRARMAL